MRHASASRKDRCRDDLPEGSPLWEIPNVIIPHSGRTPSCNQRTMTIFPDNLKRYQTGLPQHKW